MRFALLTLVMAIIMFSVVAAQAAPAPAPAAASPAAVPVPTSQQPLDVPIFPLEQLTAGMKGTGYTVIRGTTIESFDVEVLELVPKGGFDGGPLILARFTGKAVDFSNGIAGGYSGSPVYINGKLLGAVSMAMPFTDTHVGGITPIQSMLAALPDSEETDYSKNTVLPPSTDSGEPLGKDGEEPPSDNKGDEQIPSNPAPEGGSTDAAPGQASQITYMDSMEAARQFNETARALGQHHFAGVQMKTPVYFSGLSPNVRVAFGKKFASQLGTNVEFMDRPMGKAADYGLFLRDSTQSEGSSSGPGLLLLQKSTEPPLKGGDAIAVSLIQGDIEAYAVGTLTYSDAKGRFLCFGHPMLQSGKTNLPIGKAYVTWTFKSLERAFKEGVRLDTVGTMTKDQSAACGGSFTVQPDMIPVRVKIKDTDLGAETTKRFSVIRHPDFTPLLIAMGMSQSAMEALDRQPNGTMKVSYHIEGVGLKEPLRRTNYYSDDMDVVVNASNEVAPISNLLDTNIYRDVKVTKVEVMIEITRNRINASIDDAKIVWEKPEGQPGEQPAATPPTEQQLPIEKPKVDTEAPPSDARAQGDQPVPQDGQGSSTVPGMTPPMGIMPVPLDIPTFKPGDTIRVKVRLQPYRTDPVWREFSINVPSDFPAGSTMIVVHGGGDLISMSELSGKGRSLFGMGPAIDVKEHDLDSVLTQITEWPMNNELLITLVRPYDPSQAQQLGQQQQATGEAAPVEDKVDAKYQMEWVIYNGFMLPVNIVTAEQQQAAATTPAVGATSGAGDESSEKNPSGDDQQPDGNGDNGDGTDLPF